MVPHETLATLLRVVARCYALLRVATHGTAPSRQSGRPDLNRGPPAPKAGAIPGYATPREPSNVSRPLARINRRLSRRLTPRRVVGSAPRTPERDDSRGPFHQR